MLWYNFLYQDHARLQPSNTSALDSPTNSLLQLYQLLRYGILIAFRYVELKFQLIASATWNLCRFSWLSPTRRTFVSSVGCLDYVESLSPELVDANTWDLCCLSWFLGYVPLIQTSLALGHAPGDEMES